MSPLTACDEMLEGEVVDGWDWLNSGKRSPQALSANVAISSFAKWVSVDATSAVFTKLRIASGLGRRRSDPSRPVTGARRDRKSVV